MLYLLLCVSALIITGCGSFSGPTTVATPPVSDRRTDYLAFQDAQHSQEMVIYALGLLGKGYRFGGRNPEAGLDCSGMVSYVAEQVGGLRLPHNAAQIAQRTRPISKAELQPGDLVFFNTQKKSYSHMGIYIGEGKFIHAPSSRGSVRVEKLDSTYFASRFDGARTLLANQ